MRVINVRQVPEDIWTLAHVRAAELNMKFGAFILHLIEHGKLDKEGDNGR